MGLYTVYLTFDSITTEISTDTPSVAMFLQNQYRSSPGPRQARYRVKIDIHPDRPFTFRLSGSAAQLSFPRAERATHYAYFLRLVMQMFLIKHGLLFLHASTVEEGGRAYLFCGKSGVGKTTTVRGVPPAQLLSDDTAVLSVKDGRVRVLSSPFDRCYRSALPVALGRIYTLKKSSVLRLRSLTPAARFQKLIENSVFFYYISRVMRRAKPGSGGVRVAGGFGAARKEVVRSILHLLPEADIVVLYRRKADNALRVIRDL